MRPDPALRKGGREGRDESCKVSAQGRAEGTAGKGAPAPAGGGTVSQEPPVPCCEGATVFHNRPNTEVAIGKAIGARISNATGLHGPWPDSPGICTLCTVAFVMRKSTSPAGRPPGNRRHPVCAWIQNPHAVNDTAMSAINPSMTMAVAGRMGTSVQGLLATG